MKTKKTISLHLIGLLIRNDIWRVYKSTGMIAGALFLVLFLVQYIRVSSRHAINPIVSFFQEYAVLKSHYSYFSLILFIGGILFTHFVLADLAPRGSRRIQLGVPADNLEKVAAKWILTGLIFPITVLIAYWLFVLILGWLISQSLGFQLVAMPLFDGFMWGSVGLYIGLQPILLLGVMSFRRFALAKTIFSVAGLLLILSVIFSISLLFSASGVPDYVGFLEWAVFDRSSFSSFTELQQLYSQAPEFKLQHLLVLLSPLLLVTSFLKFKEKEIVP